MCDTSPWKCPSALARIAGDKDTVQREARAASPITGLTKFFQALAERSQCLSKP